jgi:hypothetical protein
MSSCRFGRIEDGNFASASGERLLAVASALDINMRSCRVADRPEGADIDL